MKEGELSKLSRETKQTIEEIRSQVCGGWGSWEVSIEYKGTSESSILFVSAVVE